MINNINTTADMDTRTEIFVEPDGTSHEVPPEYQLESWNDTSTWGIHMMKMLEEFSKDGRLPKKKKTGRNIELPMKTDDTFMNLKAFSTVSGAVAVILHAVAVTNVSPYDELTCRKEITDIFHLG